MLLRRNRSVLTAAFILFCTAHLAFAQTTAFSYQGSLTDGGTAANGNFQFQFKLFDSLAGGVQIGSTLSNVSLTVNQGVFSTKLDFGANALTGANRFLEIAVRRNATESYVTLTPREQIASAPYAVRTLSAAEADVALDSQKLGGVNAGEYVTNSTLGTNSIRNQTTLQTPANFNISGNGTIGGNLGVGTNTPTSKVEIAAQNGLAITGFQPFFTLRDTSSANKRGVIQSADGKLIFRPDSFISTFPAMVLENNGNLGIGPVNVSAQAKLNVVGTSWFQGDTSPLPPAAGKGIAVGFGGEQGYIFGFDYGSFTAKNLVLNGPGGNVGIGSATPRATLDVAGNVVQNRASNGLVKAMAYINSDGTIIRCYNGITNSSSGNCGFAVSTSAQGLFFINFGFQVNDRFALATIVTGTGLPSAKINFTTSPTTLEVFTFVSSGSSYPFMVFVY